MRKLQIVPVSKMEEMRKYFYEYLTELSQFDPDIKFEEDGTPIYRWYDCYWDDKDRFPFYLIVDEKIAGLAMIRELNPMQYDFAEFYVCPEFRKDGNAIWFAKEITELFDGEFVFSTRFTNPRAIRFWDKFAGLFDNNECCDDEIWRNWTIRKGESKEVRLNLMPLYFDKIKSGEKIYEGRLNDEKRKDFKVGDTIEFFKEPERNESFKAVITDRLEFLNFDEMANKLKKAELGFADKTKEEMIDVYRMIYKKEDEEKFGVVVFKIKTL